MSVESVLIAARNEIGYKEGANNDNKFAKVAGHPNHQPWCATFIRACFVLGGEAKAIPNSAFCPHIEAWGRSGNRVIPTKEAKRGDLVLLDFSRKGRSEHIGILTHDWDKENPEQLRTIEGNTGAKSQTNGDGVTRKVRPISLIRVVIRPDWGKK